MKSHTTSAALSRRRRHGLRSILICGHAATVVRWLIFSRALAVVTGQDLSQTASRRYPRNISTMARKAALSEVSSRGVASATRSSAVYEQLRSDISHGVLDPGSKLRVEAMCSRYGVGASPLREALSRLSAEGWVDRTDLRGFSVAPLHWEELPILTQNRVQLEGLALRESIERRDATLEDELAVLVHRLSRTPRSLAEDSYVVNPTWEALHREFHRALLSRCPSRWLRAFCESLAEESYRFRQIAAGKTFTSRDEHAEHVAIFEAVIEGRTEDALLALKTHYLRTASLVADQASKVESTPETRTA